MQSKHRRIHRWMWLAVGSMTLAALVYALVHPIEMPVMDSLPVDAIKHETP